MITSRTLAPSDLAACARVAAYVLAAVERAGLLTDDRPALAVDALTRGDVQGCNALAGEHVASMIRPGVHPTGAAVELSAVLSSVGYVGLHAIRDGRIKVQSNARRFADILVQCGEDPDAARAIVAELAA